MPSVSFTPINSSWAVEIDGDDAGGARIAEFGQLGLFHRAVARGEEDVAAGFFQIARRHQRGEVLVLLEFHQAGDGLAARGRGGLGNFVHLEPVDAALGAEQQNVAVRRGDEEMLDEVLFARLRADAAFAAARLVAIDVHRRALDVAGMADGDGHVRIGDQVFDLDLVDGVHDLRAALVAVFLLDLAQLADDHLLELLFAGENFLRVRRCARGCLQFLENFVDRELREAVQLQFEDGVDLGVGKREAAGARGAFDFRCTADAIFAPVELDAFDFARLAVFDDGGFLLAEVFEQIFARFGAAGAAADDAE